MASINPRENPQPVFVNVGETDDELLLLSALFMADFYNAPVAETLFGAKRSDDAMVELNSGEIVDEASFTIASLHSLLATAYLAGRADQIFDMENSNVRRTVKARNLANVVAVSNSFYGATAPRNPKEIAEMFGKYRGILVPSAEVVVTMRDVIDAAVAVSDESLGAYSNPHTRESARLGAMQAIRFLLNDQLTREGTEGEQ